MITDTQLNVIFSEILKGPTEMGMMLLVVDKVRIVTGKWHLSQGSVPPCKLTPMDRKRMLLWIAYEGPTYSVGVLCPWWFTERNDSCYCSPTHREL